VGSFGIVRKAFYYEKLLKCLANFSAWLSETGLLIKICRMKVKVTRVVIFYTKSSILHFYLWKFE